jgi:hypothetical protein
MQRLAMAALAGALSLAAAQPAAAQRFDWSEIGAAFCRHAIAGDMAAMGPILTAPLRELMQTAARRGTTSPRFFVQSYDAAAPGCTVRTRNAAIVEIERTVAGGGQSWIDYLVMVPEADGGTRIDDILFSTRRSDTLRTRLAQTLGGG